jgi:hypothetical protein
MCLITNAPEVGFLPGTTDLLHGRLTRGNRFDVIQYSLRQEFIPPPRLPPEFCIFGGHSGHNPFHVAVISSTRNPVYAKQKLSPLRSRGLLFLSLLLIFLVACPISSRADSLEDAARALARKVSAVPQRERRFFLSWQNRSSLADERSQALKEFFTDEFGGENLAEGQESGARALQVSIEETPASYVLIGEVPTATGEMIRISRFARTALPSTGTSGVQHRLLKELIWQQQDPILDAVETGEDPNKLGPLLILNRDNLSLYRREADHWGMQDVKPIRASEKPLRDLRGEIRFSWDHDKQNTVVLPGKTCDLQIAEKIMLNCRPGAQTWREGILIASSCNNSAAWLSGESGDWGVPDRLLLRNPSLPKSAPSLSELGLPGPLLSISTGHAWRSTTAVVFNLTMGNYEIYRITLVCGN